MSITALVVAVVSVIVAVWQGRISKQQLDLARDTERRTERTLDEIKSVTAETRQVSQDVKNSIEDRITKILDSRLQADEQTQANGAAMTQVLLEGIKNSMLKSQQPKD